MCNGVAEISCVGIYDSKGVMHLRSEIYLVQIFVAFERQQEVIG